MDTPQEKGQARIGGGEGNMINSEEFRGVRVARRILFWLAIYGGLLHGVIFALMLLGDDADKRAGAAMGLGLVVIWCVGGGVSMRFGRERFVDVVTRVRMNWRVRFVLLCIVMALLEEVVTTSMTNLGPFFGATSADVKITISTNYFEVIQTSVVAFVPWFIFWAWFLGRYDFKVAEVMVLFGFTGTVAEISYTGVSLAGFLGVAFWTYVYGLMVYLPVQTIPPRPDIERPRWWHAVVAVFLPLVFIIPFAIFVVGWCFWRVGKFMWGRDGK